MTNRNINEHMTTVDFMLNHLDFQERTNNKLKENLKINEECTEITF